MPAPRAPSPAGAPPPVIKQRSSCQNLPAVQACQSQMELDPEVHRARPVGVFQVMTAHTLVVPRPFVEPHAESPLQLQVHADLCIEEEAHSQSTRVEHENPLSDPAHGRLGYITVFSSIYRPVCLACSEERISDTHIQRGAFDA
jgi:hypothetical protein